MRAPPRSFETGSVLLGIGVAAVLTLQTTTSPRNNLWNDAIFLVFFVVTLLGLALLLWGLLDSEVERRRNARRSDELAAFLEQADELFMRSVRSDQEVAGLEADATAWATAVRDYLAQLSDADAVRFLSNVGGMALSYNRAYNKDHNQILNALIHFRDNLRTILDEQVARR